MIGGQTVPTHAMAKQLPEAGFPCLCWKALPSWIPSTSPVGCCVAGGLEVGAGLVRGHKLASGVKLVNVPLILACCHHAW